MELRASRRGRFELALLTFKATKAEEAWNEEYRARHGRLRSVARGPEAKGPRFLML